MSKLIWLEWKVLWRSRALPLYLACWAVLATAALTMTVRDCATQRHASETAAAADYQRWLSQGEKYAHTAAHYGMYAFRPVFGTAIMDPGVTPYVGQSVYLEAHVQDPTVYRPADDNITVVRMGSFTPAWTCIVMLPLLVIVLGFGSVAQERSRGTLRLSLLQSQSAIRLLTLRFGSLLPWSTAPVVLTATIAWTAAHALHMPQPAHAGSRWFLLTAALLVHLAFWTALTVGVSALSRTAAASLASSLTAWLLLCVLLPFAAIRYASAAAPTPTRQQIAQEMRAATNEGEDHRSEEQLQQRMLARYGVSRVEDLPVNLDGIRREAAEEAGDVVFDRFWGLLFHQYEEQQKLLQRFAWLSPALASSLVVETAASTDVHAHVLFVHQAEDHRRLIQRTINQELARKRDVSAGPRPTSGPELWARVPAFRFRADEGLSPTLRWSLLGAFAVQCACAGLLLAFGARALERTNA